MVNFFFGSSYFPKEAHCHSMQTHLAQIGPNRPQKDMRIGWDKNRLGPDRLGKDWMLEGYRLAKNPTWPT